MDSSNSVKKFDLSSILLLKTWLHVINVCEQICITLRLFVYIFINIYNIYYAIYSFEVCLIKKL
jgi:hypothetical protein